MTITKLIQKLQAFQDLYGNVLVECRNPAGDFDEICEVQVVNVSKPKGPTYRIFVDC